MWFLSGEMDLTQEKSRVDSMNDYLDWFVQAHDRGGHGGPMIINHTNKVVGHWYKHGIGNHPKTEKEARFVEGFVHRGPPDGEGGFLPFPNADKVWSMRDEIKGSSWGASILEEDDVYHDMGWKEYTENVKAAPYEISLVLDWEDGPHSPADPNATPIMFNDDAKSIETKEETKMTDEKPAKDDKDEDEESPVEEKKEDTFDVQKAFDELTTRFNDLEGKLKEGAYPMSNADNKKEDEEDKEDKKKPEDDEKTETDPDPIKVFPDEWKAVIDKEVEQKVEEKFKAMTEVNVTPPPPQEKVKEEEKEKTPMKPLWNMTPAERRVHFQNERSE